MKTEMLIFILFILAIVTFAAGLNSVFSDPSITDSFRQVIIDAGIELKNIFKEIERG